jgi:phage gpG-like protein
MSNVSAYSELASIREKLGFMQSDRVRRLISMRLADETILLIRRGFTRGMSPYGKPWKPNKTRTAILLKTWKLYKSFRRRLLVKGFSVTTNVKYANAQNYGRPEINLPARQFMPEPRKSPVLPPSWRKVWDAAAEEVVHPYIT